MRPRIRGAISLAAMLAIVLHAPPLLTQEAGTVRGTVLNAETEAPVAGAQISVEGTERGTLTGQDGTFEITNVPAGNQTILVTSLGFSQARQEVAVEPGIAVQVAFEITESALEVEGFIVTATGQQARRRELGNVVGSINVPDVELGSVTNMSDLLAGRSAGVTVMQSGGTTGTGSRIRIRGSNSVSLSNAPLLIIDGIRIDSNAESFSLGLGGQSTSRLDDLNPADIQNIEILKGPAASALYGTAAANGVIQITTRRGEAGEARWNFYSEQGAVLDRNIYPANYEGLDAEGNFCPAITGCEQTELLTWNPLMDRGSRISNPELGPASPFRDGHRQKYGLNVRGGNEGVTYFVSGEFEDEEGIYEINNLDRVNLRANLQGQLRDNLEIQVSSGYLSSDLSLPYNDNTVLGPLGQALLGFAEDDDDLRGYEFLGPDDLFAMNTGQEIERYTGSLNANWSPLEWLNVVATGGLDVLNRHDNETIPPERVFFSDLPEGQRSSNRIQVGNYTSNLSATGSFELSPAVTSQTSLGAQYHREQFRGTYAFGAGLLAGSESLGGTATRFSVNEQTTDLITLGAYAQQQFGFNDRIFVTAAVRGDDNNAFGQDFGLVYYPSLSASWVLDEESWFPRTPALSSFRARAAFGQSGLQPGFRDAALYYSPEAVRVEGVESPAFTFGGAGNLNLSPERSTEFETGFDLGLFEERVGVEFTYYDKRSEDALIQRRLAPSLGVSATRFENIGRVRNTGLEAVLNGQILNTPRASWDATVSLSTNRNELLELGDEIEPIVFGLGGDSQRHIEGFPLGGYWARPIVGWEDENGDGIIGPGEVQVGDTAEFRGSPFPTREVTLSSSATLFDFLRLSGMLDYQGGHKLLNSTEDFRCSFFICRGVHDPDAPEAEQVAAVANVFEGTLDGHMEDGDFVTLRELSLTLLAPGSWTERLGVGGVSLTLSGRNLGTWTDYRGIHPEMNFAGQSNFATADFLTQPPIRYYTARLSVDF